MKRLILCILFLVSPAAAQNTPVTDSDVKAALDECMPHLISSIDRQWAPGWEHCNIIKAEWGKRARAAFEREKTLPPVQSKSTADRQTAIDKLNVKP